MHAIDVAGGAVRSQPPVAMGSTATQQYRTSRLVGRGIVIPSHGLLGFH